MALFTYKWLNKVDRKGRVSIPARFRSELAGQVHRGVAVYPSIDGTRSLTGCGADVLDDYSDRFRNANPFAPAYADARRALFSNVELLNVDGDGRVQLTADLLAHAGITTHAFFVGMGHEFRVWEPETYNAMKSAEPEASPEERANLELPPAPGGNR